MEKSFDIQRFKKVLVNDFHNTVSRFGVFMLILALLPHLLWLLSLVSLGQDPQSIVIPPQIRYRLISVAVVFAAIAAPSRIYKNCNLPGSGNYFALMPASLPEKFISMMIYCFIVSPIVVFVGSVAVDTLFSWLPFGAYDSYLWQGHIQTEIGGLAAIDWRLAVENVLSDIFLVLLFFFTNTLFKKFKLTQTILWSLLAVIVLAIIITPILIAVGMDVIHDAERAYGAFEVYLWIRMAIAAILDVLLVVFSYRRLKRMQY